MIAQPAKQRARTRAFKRPRRHTSHVEVEGRKLVMEICPDRIEIRRAGERSPRVLDVMDLWRLATPTASDSGVANVPVSPVAGHVVFRFVKHQGNHSMWMRVDNSDARLFTEREAEAIAAVDGRRAMFIFAGDIKGGGK